jgi:hypothetical protein
MAGSLAEEELLPRLVEQLRTTFGVQCAAVLRQDNGRWQVEAAFGAPVPATPDHAEVAEPLGPQRMLT